MPSTVTANPPVAAVPDLDIDRVLYKHTGGRPHPRGVRERRIVANLIEHLKRAGFHLRSVWDGEEVVAAVTPKQAMELVFNLDEATLHFYKTTPTRVHAVLLVVGNDCDIISDWTYRTGDPDGFNVAMGDFDPEHYA